MIRGVVLAAALLCACGDDRADPPVTIEAHGLRVTVTPVPARIEVVRVSDGEVIFDGAYGGPAGTAAPPHVAAAFRVAVADIETQTGAFKIEDDAEAPWLGVETFQEVGADGDAITFTLAAAGGARIGVGRVELDDGQAHVVLGTDLARGFDRASITFASPPDEHLLGLGGQAFDVDHRGQTVPLWVEEDGIAKRDDDAYEGVWFLSGRRHTTHTPMPVFLSSRGYVAALDTDTRAVFALASEGEDVNRLEAWDGAIDLRLFVGEPDGALLDALDGYTAWVGRPDAPPDAVFAPWLDALYGSDNVRRVALKLRAAGIPSSAIWTEDFRGGNDEGTGYVLEEDWHIDADLYPDFTDVATELQQQGFQWLTYNNTFLDESADVFDEAIAAGYTIHHADGTPYLFTGVKFRDASMLDLTSEDARAWASAVLGEQQAAGAGGWMADFGEWLPPDAVLANGVTAMREHNAYPVRWAQLNHDLLAPGSLYFMRSAWLGSQPYTQVMWAGDQQTDWSVGDGMPSVIPIGLGLGVTGFPYYGHDLGGYMSQLTVPTTKELWFRWCTLSALTPVMRTHHGRSARDNWNWESDDATTAHFARWTRLHMSLFPYLEAMSQQVQERGTPIMRPVALGYPDTGAWAWTTTDEYLLGDRILVAPVITEGATGRDVMLPDGDWVPLLGGAIVSGGDTPVHVDAAVTEIPAFVPAGAVLPMLPDGVETVLPSVTSDRVIVLYPGDPVGDHAIDAPLHVTWTGCALTTAPATADVDGADVAVTMVDGDASVTVTAAASNTIDYGGCIATLSGGSGQHYELRLRLLP